MITLDQLIQNNSYTSEFEICPGCENHCSVKLFHFQNGNTFFSGNNCEKVYSNSADGVHKGVNMFVEKYRLLFHRPIVAESLNGQTIGIPRALGMYENYPFWHTLFTCCGFKVVLSNTSTNKLYENGLHFVMADNICFPAKLMHGHILDLVQRKVNRIFYPYVVYERKEDEQSRNSFNCPVVAGYSDVIRSSMNVEERYGIPFDSPVITFSEPQLTRKSCLAYLMKLGVAKNKAEQAIAKASQVQDGYLNTLTQRGLEVLQSAEQENRLVIMLAARPYHVDPLIEHKISQAIAAMGVDVITENAASMHGASVYGEVNAVTQWSYPNRIFKAARFVGQYGYQNLHLVQLTSFGCGPDAFILDEVNSILKRYGKNQTILKIDDVNNIGSLRLRVRSLIESVSVASVSSEKSVPKPFETTAVFGKEERKRKLIAPYFAEGYSEFVETVFKVAGYDVDVLPLGCQRDAETGLKYANNDVCYPATIVIGSIMNALQSGRYDLDNVAVIMSQTGGQCRASNYLALIKNALVSSGMKQVPVISLALGDGLSNQQPGFKLNWRKLAPIVLNTILYADALSKLFHATVVRETEKGSALNLRALYTRRALPLIENKECSGLRALIREAALDFANITDPTRIVPVIGIVGEIYVKYNGFSNKFVVNWLENHGVEVVAPALFNFFTTNFVNYHTCKENHIKNVALPLWITDQLYKLLKHVANKYDKSCAVHPFYRPFSHIFEDAELAKNVVNLAGDFGEGWELPGEICHLVTHGVQNIVSLQPFGCIANHIISKGIEKRIKQIYPRLNLLFLDFDSGTSEANVFNRLHFMVENCKSQLLQNQ